MGGGFFDGCGRDRFGLGGFGFGFGGCEGGFDGGCGRRRDCDDRFRCRRRDRDCDC
jgi:hypothetical protein